MAGESLTFDFVGRGADQLSGQFRSIGSNAEIAAKGAKALKDALDKQQGAAPKTAAEMTALSKAVKLFGDAEDKAAVKALAAQRAIDQLGTAADEAAAKTTVAATAASAAGAAASEAGGGFEALQSPMAAAAGAAVILSPVVATLGVGLGGLGLAAAGVAKPIEAAAQQTGGLEANMASLSPALQPVAQGLIGLQKNYQSFTSALQPQVIGVFNSGIQLAGHLLSDIQPIAAATGTAFQGFLSQLDKEFQGGEFQSFFQFMARTAGPDMQLVGNLVTDLAADLPPLLEGLQPIAQVVLQDADSFLQMVGSLEQAIQWVQKTTGVIGGLGTAVKDMIAVLVPFLPLWEEFGPKSKSASDGITDLTSSITGLAAATQGAGAFVTSVRDGFIEQRAAALTAASGITAVSSAYSQLLGLSTNLETAQLGIEGQLTQIATQAKATGATFTGVNTQSQALQTTFEGMVPGVQNVVAGMKQAGASGTDLAAVIASDLKPAIDAGALSNSAFKEQIYALATEAGYAGPDAIGPLTKFFDQAATSAQNVANKVNNTAAALAALPSGKNITVTMTGNGYYTISEGGANLGSASHPSTSVQISAGAANSPHAAGGFISAGTGPRADDVPILVSKGEYVVKASSVSKYGTSTLDAINAGKFAGGGQVAKLASGGPASGNLTPGYIGGMYSAFQSSFQGSFISSMQSAVRSASHADGGPVLTGLPVFGFADGGRARVPMITPYSGSSGGGGGYDKNGDKLDRIASRLLKLIDVASAIPRATGQHVAAAAAGPTANATFRARFPHMAR